MVSRGCGDRVQGGLYLCSTPEPWGYTIEHFLIDPPTPWTGSQLRSPMVVQANDGINHLFMGIGRDSYPFVPDFVEEARLLGVSKRIPMDFELGQIASQFSKLYLIHPRAIPGFKFVTPYECPWGRCELMQLGMAEPCPTHSTENHGLGEDKSPPAMDCVQGDLWSLSAVQDGGMLHFVNPAEEDGRARVSIPCGVTYEVPRPLKFPKAEVSRTYSPGIILAIPNLHLEFVNREGTAPVELIERVKEADWSMKVVSE